MRLYGSLSGSGRETVKNKYFITESVHGDAKVKPQLVFLSEHIKSGSAQIVCEVGRFSRYELQLLKNIIRARVRSGMVTAKEKGKQIGRRPITKADLPAVFIKYYHAYADGTMTVTEQARVCGLSRPTIYKYI